MKRSPGRLEERKALSPDQVVELGIAAADRDGLPAVSMRRIARELSVTPMALYWHFDNKDQLLDAMAERVIAASDFPDLPEEHWEDRLRAVLESLIDLLRAHPWMGRVDHRAGGTAAPLPHRAGNTP